MNFFSTDTCRGALVLALALISFPFNAAAEDEDFVHPGGLHTQADLDRMKTKVAAEESPWIDGWNVLSRDRKAQSNYGASPHPHMASRQRAQDDANAAYLNALRWYISGDEAHAECAVRILNDWAGTMTEKARGNDHPGLTGIPSGTFAIAAEVLRLYPGWAVEDQEAFKYMLLEYLYPVCHDFLVRHNGAADSKYWANWDTCNMNAIIAIGVFCDDREKFDEAIEYFKHGIGMGSIENAVPYRYPGGLGQWQESGRDQAHVMGGQGLLAEMCQIAWNQGVNLFCYNQNALLAGAEYTAQYNLWKGVPYTFYNNADEARQCYISENYHGRLDASHFELLYNHYVVRQGLEAPHVKLFAELRRPEPGEIDVVGYGTLTYTLDAEKSQLTTESPPVPLDIAAVPGMERVELKWSPSGAYKAHGYEISRATAKDGPYTSVYSTKKWTTPRYTDTDVEGGKTYYYTVTALNVAGKSAPSTIVSATPAKEEQLPRKWEAEDIGNADVDERDLFSPAANHSFRIVAGGRDVGGEADDCHFVYTQVEGDFTFTARLIDRTGRIFKTGLMMREGRSEDEQAVALTLGEYGYRQCHFFSRKEEGENMSRQKGNDYTWIPVWLRIQREGDTFTATQSSDGIEWFPVGSSTIDMSDHYLVGLVAADEKSTDSDPLFVTFDNVTLERTLPLPPATPTDLVATAHSGSEIHLTWKNKAEKQTGFKVEASTDGELFYEIADLTANATSFVNTGLTEPGALTYRIRAYNTGGYSGYSNTASLQP